MHGITLELEPTEQDDVQRHAEALGVSSEDIAYTALHRLLRELKQHPEEINHEIFETRAHRPHHQPIWDASGRTAHPFEDAGNDYAVPGL